MRVLSIDPGSKKCGISVVGENLEINELKIVETDNLADEVADILKKYDDINIVLLGNKTASKNIENKMKKILSNKKIRVVKVEEEYSTQEGREEFIKRKGFWKSIFKSNFDEWASYILVKRYFKSGEDSEEKENQS